MGIRFAKEFHDYPAESVACDKTPEDRSRRWQSLRDDPEQGEEEQPFKTRFIELRGMAADRSPVRKHHAPLDIGRSTVQFSIDEIAEPPEP